MSTPKHAAKTLVRMWRNGFSQEGPSAWVDWEEPEYGGFVIANSHPLARELWRDTDVLLTVYSTDELIWSVTNIERHNRYLDGNTWVSVIPYQAAVRRSIVSDAHRTEKWLEAESRHGASA